MTLDLRQIQALVLDMDGVLYRGSEPLPGAHELSATLRDLDLGCVCLTNNSSKLPATFTAKLAAMQIDIAPEAIITSSTAAREWLRERYPAGTRVYAIGMEGVQQALFHDGYFERATVDAEVVVAGIDFEVHYDKLRIATLALRGGADFVATNADRTFPAPEGLVPGAGAIIAALVAASDKQPVVIGKPEAAMFEAALSCLGLAAAQVLMVGDRLDTDIAGAQRVGMPTAWLASGVHTCADADAWQPQPDLLLPDLAALLALLREEQR